MTKQWNDRDRAEDMKFTFDDGSFYEHRTVVQSLRPDPHSLRATNGPTFRLYYFVKDQTYATYDRDEDKPTILFAAGGPGQIILPDTENFVDMYGYRVVYFHLRGSGFSQIPAGGEYDRFLRTSYVVQDLRKIRDDLHIGQWTAVIGHSYGAVVAQRYAAEYPREVAKVVLSAPTAATRSHSGAGRAGSRRDVRDKTLESLERIYKLDSFQFLDQIKVGRAGVREFLNKRFRNIVETIEQRYGNVQALAENYDLLKTQLAEQGLNLDRAFIGAIRRLRHVGWLPLDVPLAKPIKTAKVDDTQVQCGLVIAKAILKERRIKIEQHLGAKDSNLRIELLKGENLLGGEVSKNTARTYYAISYYDGLNAKLLDFRSAKSAARGIPQLARFLAGIGQAKPRRAFDPARWAHKRPTLVLKGGADPVTQDGQAEHYFKRGLTGEKVFFEFPGVGHSMALPDLRASPPELLEPVVKIRYPRGEERRDSVKFLSSRDKLIDVFLHRKSARGFERTAIVNALRQAFASHIRELPQGVVGQGENFELVVESVP